MLSYRPGDQKRLKDAGKEYRLTVFENSLLSRIFGPGEEEVIGRWTELHNEGLHNLALQEIL